MHRLWSGVLAAVLVTTVGPVQGARQGADAPPQEASESVVGKTITVDGCIQNAPAATAAAPSAKFVLAVKPATGASGGAGTRYQLDGEEKAIVPHLNHQVEVRGLVQGTAAVAGAAPARGGGAPMLILKVEWVKMVAATCS